MATPASAQQVRKGLIERIEKLEHELHGLRQSRVNRDYWWNRVLWVAMTVLATLGFAEVKDIPDKVDGAVNKLLGVDVAKNIEDIRTAHDKLLTALYPGVWQIRLRIPDAGTGGSTFRDRIDTFVFRSDGTLQLKLQDGAPPPAPVGGTFTCGLGTVSMNDGGQYFGDLPYSINQTGHKLSGINGNSQVVVGYWTQDARPGE